eukprot:evm.model.scf_2510EXC.1 EVM.evm.TU.scf_2510EXC.1   scf_2510EXC:922-1845(+)
MTVFSGMFGRSGGEDRLITSACVFVSVQDFDGYVSQPPGALDPFDEDEEGDEDDFDEGYDEAAYAEGRGQNAVQPPLDGEVPCEYEEEEDDDDEDDDDDDEEQEG